MKSWKDLKFWLWWRGISLKDLFYITIAMGFLLAVITVSCYAAFFV